MARVRLNRGTNTGSINGADTKKANSLFEILGDIQKAHESVDVVKDKHGALMYKVDVEGQKLILITSRDTEVSTTMDAFAVKLFLLNVGYPVDITSQPNKAEFKRLLTQTSYLRNDEIDTGNHRSYHSAELAFELSQALYLKQQNVSVYEAASKNINFQNHEGISLGNIVKTPSYASREEVELSQKIDHIEKMGAKLRQLDDPYKKDTIRATRRDMLSVVLRDLAGDFINFWSSKVTEKDKMLKENPELKEVSRTGYFAKLENVWGANQKSAEETKSDEPSIQPEDVWDDFVLHMKKQEPTEDVTYLRRQYRELTNKRTRNDFMFAGGDFEKFKTWWDDVLADYDAEDERELKAEEGVKENNAPDEH